MTRDNNRDIKNLFFVLGSSLICAALLSYFFIYYYGPSGKYKAGNTLVDPSLVSQIDLGEKGQKAGFVFDRFEFSYFDRKIGKMVPIPIQREQYQLFYRKISPLLSLESTAQLEQLFLQSHPALLTTHLRTIEGGQKGKDQIFQIAEFIEENYFRVQLEGNRQDTWAYFYQPDLYQEIFTIFLDDKR